MSEWKEKASSRRNERQSPTQDAPSNGKKKRKQSRNWAISIFASHDWCLRHCYFFEKEEDALWTRDKLKRNFPKDWEIIVEKVK